MKQEKGSDGVEAITVALTPDSAGVGSMVTVEAHLNGEAAVVQMLGEVLGYGFTQYLTRQGAVWSAQVSVPYGAAPGDYTLEVRGIDGQGKTLAAGRAVFHVTA